MASISHPVQTGFILWTDSPIQIGRISSPELCLQMLISLYVCFFRIFLAYEEGIVYMIGGYMGSPRDSVHDCCGRKGTVLIDIFREIQLFQIVGKLDRVERM